MRRLFRILAVVAVITCFQSAFAQAWQWQNPLPQGSRFYDVDFIDANHGWAAGERGVLYRTSDGGLSWDPLNDGSSCSGYDVCFQDLEHGWMAQGRMGLRHTTDGGVSWLEAVMPDTFSSYNIVRFASADTGWAFGQMGYEWDFKAQVIHTEDGGATWTHVISMGDTVSFQYPFPFLFAAVGGLHAWLLCDSLCVRTTDGGVTWSQTPTAIEVGDYGTSLTFTDPLSGWLTSFDDVSHTTDGGVTWVAAAGLPAGPYYGLGFSTPQEGYLTTDQAIYLTHDGGSTWMAIPGNPGYAYSGMAVFETALDGWIIGASGRLACTHDAGATWLTFGHGLSVQLNSISFADTHCGWAAGTFSPVLLHTTDGGWNWQVQSEDDIFSMGSVAFATCDSGWVLGNQGLHSTTDGGVTWSPVNVGTSRRLTCLAFSDARHGWVCGNADSVWQTTDGGSTWLPRQTTASAGSSCYQLEFLDTQHGWITFHNWPYCLFTTDGGATWRSRHVPSAPGEPYVAWVSADSGWTATGNDVYMTADSGDHWTRQYQSPNIYLATGIVFTSPREGWVAGWDWDRPAGACREADYFGLLHTTDGGLTWDDARSPVDATASLCFVNANHGWIIGRSSSAIMHYGPPPPPNPVAPHTPLPIAFALTAFPNPFNPTTRLEFELPRAGRVTLAIYDVTGRQVAMLADETLSAGHHVKTFDGSALSSGLYFARLESGKLHHTQKLVLLK